MSQTSLVLVLLSVLFVAVRQTSAALVEVSSTAPVALVNTAITATDIKPWSVMFDQSNNGRAAATGITTSTAAVLLHKTTPQDPTVIVKDCQILTGTTDLCVCGGGTYGGAALVSTAYGATPVTLGSVANNFVIWKAYCSVQGAAGCLNLAAVASDPTKACFVAAAAAPTATGTGTNTTTNGTVVTGGASPTPAPGVGGSSTVKGGASMTTPKMAALTIAPLAMLAVANFVV